MTLSAELEDEESATVNCSLLGSGPAVTVPASECGVRENKRYSLSVRAENMFGLFNYSQPVNIRELFQFHFF